MRYLFDSDAVNVFYDGQRKPYHTELHRHVSQLGDEAILQTSTLVLCELEYSFANAPENKRDAIRETIDAIDQDFDVVLAIDRPVAPIYGELKAWLKRERRLDRQAMKRHNIDLLLASSAMTTSSVLIGMDRLYEEIARFNQTFQ